ncbi:hypothetical protein L596_016557 [Steinernema carpocapsae]|uniref:Uncharacterized protein n=1 Tax=Steinernema carpocapsae TaxID=34508 RepID=A0A4V6A3G9_STECR|nr:hypothetical protein L596_016557 [Steinernema carpocapsae]
MYSRCDTSVTGQSWTELFEGRPGEKRRACTIASSRNEVSTSPQISARSEEGTSRHSLVSKTCGRGARGTQPLAGDKWDGDDAHKAGVASLDKRCKSKHERKCLERSFVSQLPCWTPLQTDNLFVYPSTSPEQPKQQKNTALEAETAETLHLSTAVDPRQPDNRRPFQTTEPSVSNPSFSLSSHPATDRSPSRRSSLHLLLFARFHDSTEKSGRRQRAPSPAAPLPLLAEKRKKRSRRGEAEEGGAEQTVAAGALAEDAPLEVARQITWESFGGIGAEGDAEEAKERRRRARTTREDGDAAAEFRAAASETAQIGFGESPAEENAESECAGSPEGAKNRFEILHRGTRRQIVVQETTEEFGAAIRGEREEPKRHVEGRYSTEKSSGSSKKRKKKAGSVENIEDVSKAPLSSEKSSSEKKKKKVVSAENLEDVPTARTPNKKNRSKEEGHRDDSQDSSLRKSLRSLKYRGKKSFTSVKTFISRPYKAASMQRILKKISRRQEYRVVQEEKSHSAEGNVGGQLKKGDDVFPVVRRPQPTVVKSKQKAIKSEVKDVTTPKEALSSVASVSKFKEGETEEMSELKEKAEANKTRILKLIKNNDNYGEIFLESGKPFWQQEGRGLPGKEADEEDLTDDELPMNADVLVDVHLGTIKLVEMPRKEIFLNPYLDLKILESRDELFFTRDVIFSNTVRSMVNLNDDLTDSEKKVRASKATPKRRPTGVDA